MKYLFLFFILAISGSAHSQIITTIAGNDTVGFSGDGGPATAAMIKYPTSVVIDSLSLRRVSLQLQPVSLCNKAIL